MNTEALERVRAVRNLLLAYGSGRLPTDINLVVPQLITLCDRACEALEDDAA